MVDQMAQFLVRRLPDTPPPTGFTRVLVAESIEPDARMSEDIRLEMQAAMDSLSNKLWKNEVIQERYALVEMGSAQAQKIITQTSGDDPGFFDDPLGRNPAKADQVKYHPNDVYVLRANLYVNQNQVKSRHRLHYHLTFSVAHARSRQTIAKEVFQSEYRFHPYRQEWISAAEDDQLRAAYAGE